MSKIELEAEINCLPDRVYEVSQNYSIRYEWYPFPEKIQLLEGATEIAVGTKVRVIAKSGFTMVVEFVQVSPPSVIAIKMVTGPLIVKSFAGSWLFKALPGGKTKAIFKYTIKAKNWALPYFSNKLLVLYFASKVRDRLSGLANYCNNMI